LTRPEPTIIGNCDSWKFIVGKKPEKHRPSNSRHALLQRSNKNSMHNLLTIFVISIWTTCGWTVERLWSLSILPIWWTQYLSIYPESTKIILHS